MSTWQIVSLFVLMFDASYTVFCVAKSSGLVSFTFGSFGLDHGAHRIMIPMCKTLQPVISFLVVQILYATWSVED